MRSSIKSRGIAGRSDAGVFLAILTSALYSRGHVTAWIPQRQQPTYGIMARPPLTVSV